MSESINPGPGYRDYPDHKITLKPLESVVRVTVLSRIVAQTAEALLLEESRYSPVIYVPRADVDFSLLQENDQQTYCPFKGGARYWDIRVGDDHIGSAAWGYDTPYDEVGVLKDYVAFYSDRVDDISVG